MQKNGTVKVDEHSMDAISKKRKHEHDNNNKNKNYSLITRYNSILAFDLLNSDLVILQQSWTNLKTKFSAPVYVHKYGAGK